MATTTSKKKNNSQKKPVVGIDRVRLATNQINKNNDDIYDIICETSLGNEYDRMIIYVTSILKEILQGVNGGCFDYSYVKEKIDKLDVTAKDVSASRLRTLLQ